jgi:hypothetical protein
MKIALLLLLAFTRIASADDEVILESVCAVVEPSDLLDEASRTTAHHLLVRTLERADLLVVERDCTQTFRVAHVRIDGAVVVRIVGPHSTRRWTHATPEKLPEIYETLVRALLTDRPSADAIPVPAITTEPYTEAGAIPPAPFPTPKVDHDIAKVGLWSARLGFGGTVGMGGVSSIMVGYRHQFGEYSLDIAGGGSGSENGGTAKLSMQLLKLYGSETRAPYLGGGLSAGATSARDSSLVSPAEYKGGGFGVELSAGYAFGRASTSLQSFMQADLTLPLYSAKTMASPAVVYPATFMLSFGIAVKLSSN